MIQRMIMNLTNASDDGCILVHGDHGTGSCRINPRGPTSDLTARRFQIAHQHKDALSCHITP